MLLDDVSVPDFLGKFASLIFLPSVPVVDTGTVSTEGAQAAAAGGEVSLSGRASHHNI